MADFGQGILSGAEKYALPFLNQSGVPSMDRNSGILGGMTKEGDPTFNIDNMMNNYKTSPEALALIKAMTDKAQAAAAASGQAGSPAEQNALMAGTSQYMSDDMNNYIKNNLTSQGQALAGNSAMSGNSLNALAALLGLKGDEATASAAQSAAHAGAKGSMWGALGSLAGSFFGGL